MHDCFRTLYGADDVHLNHDDIVDPQGKGGNNNKYLPGGKIDKNALAMNPPSLPHNMV